MPLVPEESKNVGGLDRKLRATLAVVLLAISVLAATGGRRLLAVGALVGGAGLLFNAVTQFCGMNAVLGLDTCRVDSE